MNDLMDKYNLEIDFTDKFTFDAVGCRRCHGTGYLGRIAIVEILDFSENIKELILKNYNYDVNKDIR